MAHANWLLSCDGFFSAAQRSHGIPIPGRGVPHPEHAHITRGAAAGVGNDLGGSVGRGASGEPKIVWLFSVTGAVALADI